MARAQSLAAAERRLGTQTSGFTPGLGGTFSAVPLSEARASLA